jgi:tetratricopeptide (TPR) repeat protein
VDIVPTILDTLGLPVPAALPGHSLRTEADRRGGVDRPSYFEATTALLDYGGAPLDGLIVGRDKLIEAPIPELYDLEHDPGETVNTAASAGDRRRALQARLASLAPSGPAAPRAESPEAAARLRALGYTSPGVPGHRTFRDEDDAKQFVAIDRLLHEAVALGESGRFDDAIERYRSILRARPTLVAASRHLAFAYWRAGAAGPAIDTLRAALAASPGNAGIEVQLGTYLIDADRTAEAIALLTAAAAAEPDVDTLNALGLAYGRANRGREALAVFDRALALDPESGTVLANVGAVQLDLGRIDLARGAFTRAVRSEPDLPGAHAGLALVAIRTGDSRTAVDEWTRVVSLDPSNLDALYDLGIQLARDRRMAEARPYLERFARIAPPAQYAKERRTVETILGSR